MRTIEQIESEDAIFSVTKDEVKQWIEKEIEINIEMQNIYKGKPIFKNYDLSFGNKVEWYKKVLMYLEQ